MLAAIWVQPALSKSKSQLPSSSSVLARGTSVDGAWETDTYSGWWTNNCTYCTDDTGCECFLSDSDGGSGIFQINLNQYTTMNWWMEIDYLSSAQAPSGASWNYCYPASGEGAALDIGGNSANSLDYDTTGRVCSTADSNNLTYTGSFVVTGGTGVYANYQGTGTIGQAIYGRLPREVVNQIQFNGNISNEAPTPTALPTPSASPTPTPTATPTETPTATP
ncbi:MAG: hypothetical protein ABSG46_01115, partial [Candidatus Binataceae bacterium]